MTPGASEMLAPILHKGAVVMTQSPFPQSTPDPVVLNTPSEMDESRVEVFSIDGKPYTVPARPRPNIALRFLWEQRTHGVNEAAANLMVAMLGEEGFEALSNYDALTTEQFQRVMDIVQSIAVGSLEAGKA